MSLLSLFRVGRTLERLRVPVVPSLVRHAIKLLHQSYIPYSVEFAEDVEFGYGGVGNFFHKRVRVGKGSFISHFVVIGGRSGKEGTTDVGRYVRIGVGAKVLGPVKIGDFAAIGANAVVTHDVPAGAVVGGIPARVLRYMDDPVSDYELALGRTVPPEDRALAPRPPPAGAPQRNVLVTSARGATGEPRAQSQPVSTAPTSGPAPQ